MLSPFPDFAKRDDVLKLEKQWMEDRCDASKDCGAATIQTILRKLEDYISVLPTEIKPSEIIIPTKAELATDAILAELKRRGLQLAHA